MSIFLYYFERNNPVASWQDFNTGHETISTSFEKALAASKALRIIETNIVIDGTATPAFVLFDGVSSGQVLNKFKNPEADIQCKIIADFFTLRLGIKVVNGYFIFHWVDKRIDDIEIAYKDSREISIAGLGDFAGTFELEVLYKLVL